MYFMERVGSLQVPATYPYPEPDQSSSLPLSHFLTILHDILPSVLGSSKWSLSLRFSHQNPVCTSPLPPYVLHAQLI
jgi:hypothetical protein